MGASISHADASTTTPLPPPLGPVPERVVGGPPGKVGLQQLVEPEKEVERTDYLDLPTPVKYEEIQKEALRKSQQSQHGHGARQAPAL
jgi:hypothetical protein